MASGKPDAQRDGAGSAVAAFTDDEKRDWLRLIRTENIGPTTFHQLIAHFRTAAAALDAVPELRKRGGGAHRPGRIASTRDADRELRAAEKAGVRVVAVPEADYPPLLRHIDAPPPLLFMQGDPAIAARPTVAIVGSRSASAAGRQFAGILARDLGGEGIAIASGLARGIDTAAHQSALPTGTIAVVAGGIDIIYPPENAELHAAISRQGLVLSEAPMGFLPRGMDFPRRNRLISGVSSGVIVVEAAQRSGSLITARMALDQNREVFAVPGHPLDPRATGTNELIKAGACLVAAATDVMEVIAPTFPKQMSFSEAYQAAAPDSHADALDETDLRPQERGTVLEALSVAPVAVDILIRQTGLTSRQVSIALLELDLAGRIERHGQHSVSLRQQAGLLA